MIPWIIPFWFILLNLGSGEGKGKNHKTLNISRTKRAFYMKQKYFFLDSEELSFGKENKQ